MGGQWSTVTLATTYRDAQDGIVLRWVFQGSTDADVFEDFIEQLLQYCKYCSRWLQPKSVLVVDNYSFYRTMKVEQIYSDAVCYSSEGASVHGSAEDPPRLAKARPMKHARI